MPRRTGRKKMNKNKTNWKNQNKNKNKNGNNRKTRRMRKGGDSSTDIFNRVMDNPHPR